MKRVENLLQRQRMFFFSKKKNVFTITTSSHLKLSSRLPYWNSILVSTLSTFLKASSLESKTTITCKHKNSLKMYLGHFFFFFFCAVNLNHISNKVFENFGIIEIMMLWARESPVPNYNSIVLGPWTNKARILKARFL